MSKVLPYACKQQSHNLRVRYNYLILVRYWNEPEATLQLLLYNFQQLVVRETELYYDALLYYYSDE